MTDPDKTNTYSDDDKTNIYGESGKRMKETVHHIKIGDTITLNERNYQVLEIISESTGEAVIYKIEDEKQDVFALKLYFEFISTDQEPNIEALERIQSINDVDILNLHDFGTGINKYQGKFCFEISDFAYGADLLSVKNFKEKYNYEFIVNEVIPQIFLGIMHLHQNRIYHCDLKPQNIFFLDETQLDIVIGDYGSAKTFEFDAEKQSRKTTTVKGTDFYLPPEQARGFISQKNDYYSFGMILLHLVYPESVQLQADNPKIISHNKLKRIIERQFENQPIIDFNPSNEKLNHLIEGLTLADFNLRWGQNEVEKWLKGEEVKVVYTRITKNPLGNQVSSSGALRFGDYTLNTPYDLRDYILNDDNWYQDLVEDPDNWKDFINWMLGFYEGDKRKRSALNRIVKDYSQEGLDFIGEAIIRFFIPEHPVQIGLKSFSLTESDNLQKSIAQIFVYLLDEIWSNASEKDLKLYLFRIEFALRGLSQFKDNELKILQLLYNKLGTKGKLRADFYNYRVYAYTSITKKHKEKLEEFLIDYLPANGFLYFKSLSNENYLHYLLKKSLTNYFNSIGIYNTKKTKSYKEHIHLNFPGKYRSLEDFIEQAIKGSLNTIYGKHNIDFERLDKESSKQFKSNFRNALSNKPHSLQFDFESLKKKISREDKRNREVRECLQKVDDIINNNQYHQISEAFQLIDQCKNKVRSESQLRKVKKQEEKKTRKEQRKRFFSKYIGCLGPLIIGLILLLSVFGRLIYDQIASIFIEEEVIDKNTALSKVEMISIKGGTFIMGDPDGPDDEKPLHKVTLNNFALSKYEITNEQFADFLNHYGSDKVKQGPFAGKKMIYSSSKEKRDWGVSLTDKGWQARPSYKNHPVVYVTWFGANEYCNWAGGRLPTEAEWNFAAIGGNKTKNYKYAGGNSIDNIGWYKENSGIHTCKVGTKQPNELGLYDMSGNVYEWCQDWYDKNFYNKSPKVNPVNNNISGKKVLRGGSYYNPSGSSMPCNRANDPPEVYYSNYGFRLCKDANNQKNNQNQQPQASSKTEKKKTNISKKKEQKSKTEFESPQTIETTKKPTIKMVFVEGGTFTMGNREGRTSEKFEHKVTLNSFYIGKYEVTNEQFCNFLNDYGSETVKDGPYKGKKMFWIGIKPEKDPQKNKWTVKRKYRNLPVYGINWYGAREFCKWVGGRLPTEAEWEFAAKGGNQSKNYLYAGSDSIEEVAWYNHALEKQIQNNTGVYQLSGEVIALYKSNPVGRKKPNELGIYDMSGNKEEWCEDTYSLDFYNISPSVNPCNTSDGTTKCRRGGSVKSAARPCRTYARSSAKPGYWAWELGFRIVKDVK